MQPMPRSIVVVRPERVYNARAARQSADDVSLAAAKRHAFWRAVIIKDEATED
jgi:hypothetical protein